MFVTHVHNIRFAMYWANCCGSLPVIPEMLVMHAHEYRLLVGASCSLKMSSLAENVEKIISAHPLYNEPNTTCSVIGCCL